MNKQLPNIIAISGLPASGKSTLARLLAKKYKYQYLHAGDVFRKLAKDHNMSLEEFDVYCLKHPEHDKKLDKSMIDFLKNHNKVIYDGHISGWMCQKHKIPDCLKIWIEVPLAFRIKRYAGRENISLAQAKKFIKGRETFLKKRYKKLYQINYTDTSVYDLKASGKPLPPEIVKNIDKNINNQILTKISF